MIKCLSLRQPWADAIFDFGKNVENRTWTTNYRGRLYIHASKSKYKQDFDVFREMTRNMGLKGTNIFASRLMPSGILGYVDLVDVVSNSESPWAMPDQYHWIVKNPVKFSEPIDCLGQLGLWTPPPRVVEFLKIGGNYHANG